MEKVEAYRCKECEGKGYLTFSSNGYVSEGGIEYAGVMSSSKCFTCKGNKIVWLTEEEVNCNNKEN